MPISFNVVEVTSKRIVLEGLTDGSTAAKLANDYSVSTGRLHQPRKVVTEDAKTSWHDRERARFADGSYLPVAWSDNGQWQTYHQHPGYVSAQVMTHFAHCSTKHPDKIAYTESHAKGVEDKQNLMKPGKYLQAHFGGIFNMQDIRRMATQHIVKYLPPPELHFADSADEIEKVYLNGPESCMSHNLGDYNSDEHPVRAYAAGDLAVAYLGSLDEDDSINARAIVWPEKKRYCRIYGYDELMKTRLEALGYRYDSLEGAKMARIPQGNGGFLMPYLDSIGRLKDCKTHLIITRDGNIDGCPTNGLTGDNMFTCESCGDDNPEDDANFDHNGYRYCESCWSESGFYCEYNRRYEHGESVVMANGDTWGESAFNDYGFTCDGNGENYHNDEAVELADGSTVSRSWFVDHGMECAECSENIDAKDAHDTHETMCKTCGDAKAEEELEFDFESEAKASKKKGKR